MSVTFRKAEAADVPRLHAALAQLSADLGDTHRTDEDALHAAGFGARPVFRAVLAEEGWEVVGIALFSPCLSTSRGQVIAYVSDLWVAHGLRGQRLGPRLLSAVAEDAAEAWGATALKLNVYHHSAGARRFYARVGFTPAEDHTEMHLGPDAIARLGDTE
ncbi:GNAT family N-acetyltransferase [Allosediminivita pacifica]|uniref:Ribosomal protein S18 acetylase RimI-like enzyme n=1 Tax=Allosediminivita pacifica TaxID=1267769 RepID=A0A2T6B9H2_9RHOB|nr:GNAT family N-acetyltransferase [Allosediminivita pacifica]PTX52725.1 ribosomal protein S18 acetylase RimI-like enzyme [Allosediminivita pacifica]GGA96337.1 hypothetical protein GCM10011324_03290 [Allosediminivita pacifica]